MTYCCESYQSSKRTFATLLMRKGGMSRGAKSHQSHEAGSNADQRTGRNDDERQLPPFDKSDAEPAHKGGEALHEYGNLVGNGVVDLVDVTGGKKMSLIN